MPVPGPAHRRVSRPVFSLLLSLAALLSAAGCGRQEAPAPMAVEAVPQTLQGAFDKSGGAAKAAADQALEAMKNDQQAVALDVLEKLAMQAELTAEQREAAARSAIAVRQQILEAAAKGDAAAKEFLEQQRARK